MLRPLLLAGMILSAVGMSGREARAAGPDISYAAMQEAFGRLLGDLFFVGDVTGKCAAQHPALKQAADGAFADWTERNLVVTTLREALYHRARSEGGEGEVGRLSRRIEQAGQRVANATAGHARISRTGCMTAIGRIRQGDHDVARKFPREVALLLAGREGVARNGS